MPRKPIECKGCTLPTSPDLELSRAAVLASKPVLTLTEIGKTMHVSVSDPGNPYFKVLFEFDASTPGSRDVVALGGSKVPGARYPSQTRAVLSADGKLQIADSQNTWWVVWTDVAIF